MQCLLVIVPHLRVSFTSGFCRFGSLRVLTACFLRMAYTSVFSALFCISFLNHVESHIWRATDPITLPISKGTPFPSMLYICSSLTPENSSNRFSGIPIAFATSNGLKRLHISLPSTSVLSIHRVFPIAVTDAAFPLPDIKMSGENQSPKEFPFVANIRVPPFVSLSFCMKPSLISSVAIYFCCTGSIKTSSIFLLFSICASGHSNKCPCFFHRSLRIAIVMSRSLSMIPPCSEALTTFPGSPSGPRGTW